MSVLENVVVNDVDFHFDRKDPTKPFYGRIRSLGHEYLIQQIHVPECGTCTQFISGEYKGQSQTIDHAPYGASGDELGKYVKDGKVLIVSKLGSTPILTVWINKHQWNSVEYVVQSRNEMMRILHAHGYPEPWLFFNKSNVYPARMRCRPAVGINTSALSQLMNLLASRKVNPEAALAHFKEELEEPLSRLPDRFIEVDLAIRMHHDTRVEGIADLVNYIFFKLGKVLVTKRNPDREFSDYLDLKVIVDRKAPFSEGRVKHGWDKFLGL